MIFGVMSLIVFIINMITCLVGMRNDDEGLLEACRILIVVGWMFLVIEIIL